MVDNHPIVVLGSHRAGTSAVTGLLSLSGLELGRVISPSPDNPKGYFENVDILDADRRLLAMMGRDWTCPPLRLDLTHPLDRLERAVADLMSRDSLWGFKDPRSMFLLPAWARVLPGFRFIGVYRPTEAVAASIERRDGFPQADALAIARAYNERLQRLHRHLGFPIVRFDVERATLLERVQRIALLLGLTWNHDAAEDFIGDPTSHRTLPGDLEVDRYLADRSSEEIETLPSFSSAQVLDLERRADMVEGSSVPLYLGVAHKRRRRQLWSEAISVTSEVGTVLELDMAPLLNQEPLVGAASDRVVHVAASDVAETRLETRASHVLGVDALDAVAPVDLAGFISALDGATTSSAVCALGGFVIDGAAVPPDRYEPRVGLTAARDHEPYLHHRDEIEAACLPTTWLIGGIEIDEHDRTRRTVVLVKDAVARNPDMLSPFELRGRYFELSERSDRLQEQLHDVGNRAEQSIGALEAELGTTRATAKEVEHKLVGVERALIERDGQVEGLTEGLRSEREVGTRASQEMESVKRILAASDKKLAASDKKLAASDKKLAASDKKLAASDKKLARVTTQYGRLRNRRVVRLSLAVASFFKPLFQWVRTTGKKRTPGEEPRASTPPEAAQPPRRLRVEIEAAILRERPGDGPRSGPLVSMVVLTRDGEHHLTRLFQGLRDNTTYRSFEVILIDNASSDGTSALLEDDWGFPLVTIRNERNASFSEGCNQGIAAAEGKYVLLLNNDVDPINTGWLGAMVEELETNASVDAAGALLVYPEASVGASEDVLHHELTVQHRGIAFRWRLGAPIGYNLGAGEDPAIPELAATVEVPAVTAACMLVRAEVLEALDGLDEQFVYGSEDVDLNLRIRERGSKVALVGQSALFHYEFGTQRRHGGHRSRAYRSANLQYFAEKWAPRLSRTLRHNSIVGGSVEWRGFNTRKVAITLTRDDQSGGWGDWYTAHELGDAFESAGWDVLYAEAYKDRWYELPDEVDLVISLLDRYDARRAPSGAVTVAWIRNWTDRWIEQPWIAAYDVLVPSSRTSAELLEDAGLFAAGVLPLATNPERFRPMPPNAVYESDYAFTGNCWGVGRALLNDLDVAPRERFSIFGKGWDSIGRASRYWRGAVPYDDLPEVYNSARIILDDTAGPTLPYGAVNSRVFDALACGTLVVTNNPEGSDELFGGALPSFSTRTELRETIDRYLGDAQLREATVADLQRTVVENHTYETRVRQFIGLVEQRIQSPRVAMKIGTPRHEEAERWGDTHFARSFARSLELLGYSTRVDILPEWDSLESQSVDIVVHLRGLVPYVPKPSHVNVLWIISHPEEVPDRECERYDLVLVASAIHAEGLRERLSVPVATLLQASAIRRERPEAETETENEVLFVGNSRGVERPAVMWAIDRGLPIAVYGADWDGLIDSRYIRGEYVPNEDLPGVYGSASVVVNDHWPGMRDAGFISNRVFDVLASGGFIVSDNVVGIEEVFGAVVPTFETDSELEHLVRHFLDHPRERAALANLGQEMVLTEHTFDQRAMKFDSLVRSLAAARVQQVTSS